MSFHNLCTTSNPPPLTHLLLGLGHKFCVQPYLPEFDFKQTFSKITHQVRLQSFLHTHDHLEKNSTYNAKIYVKSNFTPPIADTYTESLLSNFKDAILLYATNKLSNTKPHHNLSNLQRNILLKLKSNKEITVCLSDKNLGPVLIDTTHYIKLAIKNHLSNTQTYTNLSTDESTTILKDTRQSLIDLFSANTHLLSPATVTYFKRSFLKQFRTPIFYQLIKIHKMRNPAESIPTRPVISCINSFSEIFSKYCDVLLSILSNHVPTKLKDSFEVLHDLRHLHQPLPSDSYIITADAVSMYTNINPSHASTILSRWLDLYSHELPQNFPSQFLIKSINIIMTRNVFQFGKTHYLQKQGLAMGTSCAVMLATVYYGFHERHYLIPKYNHLFIYFKRFVDDLIFITKRKLTPFEFNSLLSDLKFGDLTWTSEGQKKTQTFLDLDISINSTQVSFKTHIKKHNLHLYLPPNSCHPQHCLRSLIFGMLFRFHLQNTNPTDYINFTKSFFTFLINRGHNEQSLTNLFLSASKKLDEKIIKHHDINPFTLKENSTDDTTDIKNIFFHTKFHPDNIPSAFIQNTFSKTLQKLNYINNLTICNHRQQNLRDILIPTNLYKNKNETPTNF